VKTQWWEDGGG